VNEIDEQDKVVYLATVNGILDEPPEEGKAEPVEISGDIIPIDACSEEIVK